jgi:hypothetical protein
MVVWGGTDGTPLNTGSRYDPYTDAWLLTSFFAAPTARSGHTAVWSDTEMAVWGGFDIRYQGTGSRYDPVTDIWTRISNAGAPAGRRDHKAVWADGLMLVWGGFGGSYRNTGGRYAMGLIEDNDGDGIPACAGDCDDSNASVFPGATELCNGVDDDCDGITDDVSIVPGTPSVSTSSTTGDTVLVWSPMLGADSYDVVSGEISVLRGSGGDFAAATSMCIADDWVTTSVTVPDDPSAGEALFYLIRSVHCGTGSTYDSLKPSQVESRDAEISSSAASCP